MNIEKVGKAISYLRKRAGYTQKDLADRIGISDKAVSKWERGLGLPEIGYLRKLSILLDTDTDSLLAGDVIHHDTSWQGVLVLEKTAYGIGAETIIYDKPLINYLLSYFLLVGIKNITIICSEDDKLSIEKIFNDGSEYGFRLSIIHSSLRDLSVQAKNVMMVYGRCILYGVDQTRFFQKAMIEREHFTMLVLPKKTKQSRNQVFVNAKKKVINSSNDEPLRTQYDFSSIPIIFFPATLLEDMCKQLDVSSYVRQYSLQNDVYVQFLDRGFVEFEINNWNDVNEASTFIKIIQNKCGMNVYCVEEVAWRRGFISAESLKEHSKKYKGTEYGEYLLELCERINSTERLHNNK